MLGQIVGMFPECRLYAQRALGPTCGENEADRRDFEWALLACFGCGSETKAESSGTACVPVALFPKLPEGRERLPSTMNHRHVIF